MKRYVYFLPTDAGKRCPDLDVTKATINPQEVTDLYFGDKVNMTCDDGYALSIDYASENADTRVTRATQLECLDSSDVTAVWSSATSCSG